MKTNKVCFLLPAWCDQPIGGYKIVYEYANRLAERGWDVSILYAREGRYCGFWRLPLSFVRHPIVWGKWYWKFAAERRNWTGEVEWFKLSPKVKQDLVPWYAPWTLWRQGFRTRFVATFIWTSMCLDKAWGVKKHYLVQDFENWGGFTSEDVERTYRFKAMKKIAISKWLERGIRRVDGNVEYIPNGLDFEYFRMTNDIESRDPATVAFMWHVDKRKRTDMALAALKMVREKHSALKVSAFSAYDRPADLPEWISFEKCPSRERHNEIYNNAAIFVASSEQEGWGLTPCEAMQCGAAVACTDCGGYKSFAEDGKTALMSPINDAAALAANICRLIEDNELRIRIANAGYENIQQFTWGRAVDAMEDCLWG